MFKFSFNLVKEICGFEITESELFRILNLQGFEVDEKIKKGDDTVVSIEVKANRPDMLSHLGVAREICAFKKCRLPKIPEVKIEKDIYDFPVKVDVDPNCSKRFSLISLKNVDNNCKVPDYIKELIEKLGINSVNPIVDITNYVMLKYGQPMHVYDTDKINGNFLNIKKESKNSKITTLGGVSTDLKSGDIIVCDQKDTLCVAGIIGTEKAEVLHQTKNILLESACFDEVSVRLSSRRLKISTPSSFRFERGIDYSVSLQIAFVCAKMIVDICGGGIDKSYFDFYPAPKQKEKINLRVSRTNSVLGLQLSKETVIHYLSGYDFICEDTSEDDILVQSPTYRLDVKSEIDLIEEVARIHGYDNITPIMPKMQINYKENVPWENMDKLREIFVGLGFYEVINYSFIPSDFNDTFKIDKNHRIYSDLKLVNPINKDYALMRPTLVYSLLNCLAYNYSLNNTDLAIFEIGKVYFRDNSDSDNGTHCKEIDTFAFAFSGIRLKRGWGIPKDIKYSFYDLLNYLGIISEKFCQNFKLEKSDYGFCKNKTGFDILLENKKIGFLGELDKNIYCKAIKNAKLINDPIFYCEIYLGYLHENIKKLKFESKYPNIIREYNFMVNKNISSAEIEKIIINSSDIIRSVDVSDIYSDKKMDSSWHAILYKVNYCSPNATLKSEQIEEIEKLFISKLSEELNVTIKQ